MAKMYRKLQTGVRKLAESESKGHKLLNIKSDWKSSDDLTISNVRKPKIAYLNK